LLARILKNDNFWCFRYRAYGSFNICSQILIWNFVGVKSEKLELLIRDFIFIVSVSLGLFKCPFLWENCKTIDVVCHFIWSNKYNYNSSKVKLHLFPLYIFKYRSFTAKVMDFRLKWKLDTSHNDYTLRNIKSSIFPLFLYNQFRIILFFCFQSDSLILATCL